MRSTVPSYLNQPPMSMGQRTASDHCSKIPSNRSVKSGRSKRLLVQAAPQNFDPPEVQEGGVKWAVKWGFG